MQKGLSLLLEKYSVARNAVIAEDGKSVTIEGKAYPLMPYVCDRRFMELRGLVLAGRLGNMCTCRIGHTATVGTDLFELLAREIGILEYTVNATVTEIFAIAGAGAMNCIAETDNGCVATIELGATLQAGEASIDKHEIITDNGVALDRAVDTQVPQSSIYVFGQSPATFRDVDTELYGYTEDEIFAIRHAFFLAQSPAECEASIKKAAHIAAVVAAAKESLDTLENIKVGE